MEGEAFVSLLAARQSIPHNAAAGRQMDPMGGPLVTTRRLTSFSDFGSEDKPEA